MDHLVLIRVVAALDRQVRDCALGEILEETPHRFRLAFVDSEGGRRFVALVVEPGRAWIGRAVMPWEPHRRPPSAFALACRRALAGCKASGAAKHAGDRGVFLGFVDGHALSVELGTTRPAAVLLAPGGTVVAATLRHPARERIAAGRRYEPPGLPPGRLDPVTSAASEIDGRIRDEAAAGHGLVEAVRRAIVGIEPPTAGLLVAQARQESRTVGEVLRHRLRDTPQEASEPVIEAPADPRESARSGQLDPRAVRLLPWATADSPPGVSRFRGRDAAETAGIFYQALEHAERLARRALLLRRTLDQEIARIRQALAGVERDRERFRDPEGIRRGAEAILAGLARARRVGDHVSVPDPYGEEGEELGFEVRSGQSLTDLAAEEFRRHRRALRGRSLVAARAAELESRLARLQELERGWPASQDPSTLAEIEQRLAAERVVLAAGPRAASTRAPLPPPRRHPGVRILSTPTGRTLLAGRTGRDNQFLTFRLARPDDFWFHARGVAGAHVVLRNESRSTEPAREDLLVAAAAAAWFSEARAGDGVDVQWTRCKYVRKVRGAPPGTVRLKRAFTVRVRPALPPGEEDVPIEPGHGARARKDGAKAFEDRPADG